MWRWFTQNFFNYPVQPEYHYESLINAIKDNDKKRIEELLGESAYYPSNKLKFGK